MVKISLKVLLLLLLSKNSFALDCKPSLYQLGEKPLCFSSKLKSYLTVDCNDGKCEALVLLEQAKKLHPSQLPGKDSRHPGAKACDLLGGKTTVVTSPKTQDQICLCISKDQSGVSCSRLGLR